MADGPERLAWWQAARVRSVISTHVPSRWRQPYHSGTALVRSCSGMRPERLVCAGAAGAVARPEVGFQVLLGLPDVALGPMRLAFQQVALERLVVASAADTSKASETVYF